MKKNLLIIILAVLQLSVFAKEEEISDTKITVLLDSLGNGQITETWKVTATKGTEFYLVKNNLGKITIDNLSVKDETGHYFIVEKDWISKERSLEEKAGKCGIATTDKGKDICIGFGTYGDHTFTISYTMTNMVRSLQDADILYFQFVSSGMSSNPKHAFVNISSNKECTDIKGFGYEGECYTVGDNIIAETSSPMKSDNSVTILARFPKGSFNIADTENINFADIEKQSRDNGIEVLMIFILSLILFAVAITFFIIILDRANRRTVAGVSTLSDIDISHNVPYEGDILKSWYILKKAWEPAEYTSALVLKLARDGFIKIQNNEKGKTEFVFNENTDKSRLYEIDLEFLRFMARASGSDRILQKREFGHWASLHIGRLDKWSLQIKKEAEEILKKDGTLNQKNKFTDLGKERARNVLGYYKYLKEYEYGDNKTDNKIGNEMIFGALCGISEKMMKIYRKNPSTIYLYYLLLFNSRISAAASSHGSGGNVSSSTGRGFSGGGTGGGFR